MVFANESKPPERSSFTCHLTHPISTPLRKHGQSLKKNSARSEKDRHSLSIALSLYSSQTFDLRMQRLGSEFPCELYTNNKSALGTRKKIVRSVGDPLRHWRNIS